MPRFLALLSLAPLAVFAGVTVKDAWVRGTVPAQTTTGAFMTITSTDDAKLLSIGSPAARTVQIHSSSMKDGVMRMEAVNGLALPANKPIALEGAYHVMLMGLAKPLKAGDKVPLSLTIEDAKGNKSKVEVEAPVRPLGQ